MHEHPEMKIATLVRKDAAQARRLLAIAAATRDAARLFDKRISAPDPRVSEFRMSPSQPASSVSTAHTRNCRRKRHPSPVWSSDILVSRFYEALWITQGI
jgi:hypothetical protein